ncbi:hypothetical protein ATZ33_17370 [Enterococcus silesiacus]|uniref:Uncharacterized protein n=1 Tax=Enterococcus silesiacus TaxID=332949 RepID=A0A0S3KFK5_9ENTE|nr:hypothetical protein [Enterococcus silesiacus]ALS03082.1 hypothetical protein ATZ33_17370 [Enterococcus silesiacus]OJG93028.1 hypothetical protein RV15_GL002162 [Enterococcus silesiacus]
MFTFYWLFKKENSFTAVLKNDKETQIITDKESLKKALDTVGFLVSFGNYSTMDKEIALLLSNGKSKYLQKNISIDLSQELGNKTIEEIGFRLGHNMKAKTAAEFCEKRIEICEYVFSKREEYLESKFQIVKEFGLNPRFVMKTRASLAAEILNAKKQPKAPNILIYEYDKRIQLNELPEKLLTFYNRIKKKYIIDKDEKIKFEKIKMSLAGLTHTFGFGGVHAAKEKYKGSGLYLLIDVRQFFPSLILNNQLFSTAVKDKSVFKKLYDKKVETGQETYKVLIAAINGAMNNPYSNLYDPQKFYSVTVNGQLIITHLIIILENFIEELIQTNTDGIVVKINPIFETIINDLLERWSAHYELDLKVTKIKNIWQRDVNNYIFETTSGEFVKKGIYSDLNYLTSAIPVITEALIAYSLHGIKPQNYLIDAFKNEPIEKFYYIGKIARGYEAIEQQRGLTYKKMNNTVCGIATSNKKFGGIYQTKNDLHSKLPGSPVHFLSYDHATKQDIDMSWYVEEVEKYIY